MRYGHQYIWYEFSESALEIVNNAIEKNKDSVEFQKSTILSGVDEDINVVDEGISGRKGTVGWISGDDNLNRMLCDTVEKVNKDADWNLGINYLEPIQYGIYDVGDHYGWHNDQGKYSPGNQLVRKVSMSLFLNDPDEYEGGELDIDFKNPNSDPRYDTLKLDRGYAVFFQSHLWHRVRPVRSGVRKSLVAWFGGPYYV